MMFGKKGAALLVLLQSFVASAAFAVTVDFDLTSPVSREQVGNSTYAGTYNYDADGLGLSITGWSYKGSNYGTSQVSQAWVGLWSGLGVERRSSPQHAIDNANGDYDMLLLSFDEAVELDALSIGWKKNDSDVSLMAYTGGSDFGGFAGLDVWEDLLDEGWELEDHYSDVKKRNSSSVNDGGLSSRYWLVGAYNPNLGNNPGWSLGNDFFKLDQVSVSVSAVPLPAAFWFLASGLAAMGAFRRKARKA